MPGFGSPPDALERALQVVDEREPVVRAWVHLDRDRARKEAGRAPLGPLSGLLFGVKDIFDTGDQPTSYGSPIYSGYRPLADAAVVSLLRGAGAVALGKTVTTELAWASPGPTTNPHRSSHTPGGSSSGSAAGVAAGMVDFAVGTQTAGSIVRPASFCGVLGLKPTFGLLPTSGVKQEAPSLDTIGLFAREFEVMTAAIRALTGSRAVARSDPPRLAFMGTDLWDGADADCQAIVLRAAELLGATTRELPDEFVGIADESSPIQAFEGARSYAWERRTHVDMISATLREILDWGAGIELSEYASLHRRMTSARSAESLDRLFADVDVIVTPASVGEAPEGLSSTGNPRFNRLWTALGCPALNVPGFVGSTGLPIGVQLVARPFEEELLLQVGQRLSDLIRE
jgi:Asp-tRNA(Asn)/Glu-tRNA(Gln) amidotransferase A subunit family amidase